MNTWIVLILVLIMCIELIPYAITFTFPNLCWGCTSIGKIQQELNAKYNLAYLAWFSYTFLVIYIYASYRFKNVVFKISAFFLLFAMIYVPTLPITNIINLLLCIFFKNSPFIDDYHTIFPASVSIENHATTIIDEFKKYTSIYKPECIRSTNPGFKIELTDNEEHCWRGLYLKKGGEIVNTLISHFPTTTTLLKDPQIHNAFFSILDPGVEIPPHVGYYKGYLRYHLGVVIPNGREKAYIICGGEKYTWREQEGVLFDDMYLHNVKNPTNQLRVVLYIDLVRKSKSYFLNALNQFGIYLIENSIILNTFLKNQHGQTKIKNV